VKFPSGTLHCGCLGNIWETSLPEQTAIPAPLLAYAKRSEIQVAMIAAETERLAREETFAAVHRSFRPDYIAAILASPIRVLRLTPGLLVLLDVSSTAEFALCEKAGLHPQRRHEKDWPEVHQVLQGEGVGLTHTGRSNVSRGEYELVLSAGSRRGVRSIYIALKFVPASRSRSGHDGCWCPTFYFWGEQTIGRRSRRGTLHRVFPYQRATLGDIRPLL